MRKFLLGFFTGVIGLSIMDALASIIAQLTKSICLKIAYKDYQIEKELAEAETNAEEERTPVIGFAIPSTEDYWEEED